MCQTALIFAGIACEFGRPAAMIIHAPSLVLDVALSLTIIALLILLVLAALTSHQQEHEVGRAGP